MAFSSKNGVEMCDIASFNNISRDGSKCLGMVKGVSCTREPLVTDGPGETKAVMCTDILDREPNGPIKFSTVGAPGGVDGESDLTTTKGVCGDNKLPLGWYIVWGKDGPGYDGYQIVRTDGSDCKPAEITTCD